MLQETTLQAVYHPEIERVKPHKSSNLHMNWAAVNQLFYL